MSDDAVVQRDIDTMVERLHLRRWTPEERKEYVDAQSEHPIFMDAVPQEGTAASNEYIQAMDALLYDDDDTPDALAVAAKEKGNAAYIKGKAYHGNALRYYKEALDHCKKCKVKKSKMRQLESQVRSNMAAILLERNRSWDVLCECEKAIDLWSDNVKAYMRAGKACVALGRLLDAVKFSTAGLTFDSIDAKTKAALEDTRTKAQEKLDAIERDVKAKEAAKAAKLASLHSVRQACGERGIVVGYPLFRDMRRSACDPYINEMSCIVWPVLFLYPEFSQSDFVERFSELDTFQSHLETILPDSGEPPFWDETDGSYRLSNVEVFYRTNLTNPRPFSECWTSEGLEDPLEPNYGPLGWVRVPMHAPLLLPLVQDGYIVPDIPVFYVLARGTEYYESIKKGNGGSFKTLVVPELPPPPEDD